MNVLYILGNGFDKAQGMKTSYPEFYEYLKTIDSETESSLLNLMRKEIKADTVLWSDMEEALGKFTEQVDNFEDFRQFYFELSDHLQDYLLLNSSSFIFSDELKTKFKEDFVAKGKYLGQLDKIKYNKFTKRFSSSSQDISVITLNYTNTLERILDLKDNTNSKNLGSNNFLRDIIHVHGELGSSIIIGVDKTEQIANSSFRELDGFKDIMIKIQSNECMKYTRHLTCEDLIKKAHFIILFGVSLGETDAHWWEAIGQQFIKRDDLCIIQHVYKPGVITPTRQQLLGTLEREQQELLLKKMGLDQQSISEAMRERLLFTFNSSIFTV